jgi:hypothetical protein
MLSKNKANIHPYKGNTVIDKSKGVSSIKLMLAEGFLAYQWEKNGVKLTTTSPTYTATTAGTYRARFSRVSSAPTSEAQWNRWSDPIKITVAGTTAIASTTPAKVEMEPEAEPVAEEFSYSVYPNPGSPGNVNLQVLGGGEEPVQVAITDQMGKEVFNESFESSELAQDKRLNIPSSVAGGVYILRIQQGKRQVRTKVLIQH